MAERRRFGLAKLPAPAVRALSGAGNGTLQDLDGVPRRTLLALHGVGPRAVEQLSEAMAEQGLTLG